jgi:hypothetical protein
MLDAPAPGVHSAAMRAQPPLAVHDIAGLRRLPPASLS